MAKLKAATRNKLPSSVFELPKQRKYPMEDRTHQIKKFATKEQRADNSLEPRPRGSERRPSDC